VKGSCFDSILQANSNGFGTRLMRWLNDQNKTGNYGRRILRTVSSYGKWCGRSVGRRFLGLVHCR
jgi:hypothetical protein